MRDNKGRFVSNSEPWNKGKHGTAVITDKHISKQDRPHGLNWKGGQIIQNGRLYLYLPTHPNACSKGYVRNAHCIVEKFMNRILTKSEVVHHIDGNKLNDALDNLYLFPSKSAHCKFHGNQYQRKCPLFCKKQAELTSNLV